MAGAPICAPTACARCARASPPRRARARPPRGLLRRRSRDSLEAAAAAQHAHRRAAGLGSRRRWDATVAATRQPARAAPPRARTRASSCADSTPRRSRDRTPLRVAIERSSSAGGATSRWRRWASSSTCSRSTFALERRYFVAERDGARGRLSRRGADLRARRLAARGLPARSRRAQRHRRAAHRRGDARARRRGQPLRDARPGAAVGAGRPVAAAARTLGRAPLYDFAGLRAFKAKLRPHAWEPIYLAHAPGTSSARRHRRRAGRVRARQLRCASAARRCCAVRRWWCALLAALLVPWTVCSALAAARWFPAPWVKTAWVAFDVSCGRDAVRADRALASLARRHRREPRSPPTRCSRRCRWGCAMAGACTASIGSPSRLSIVGPTLAAVILWAAVALLHRRAALDAKQTRPI